MVADLPAQVDTVSKVVGYLPVDRMVIDLLRRAGLGDLPAKHHRHPVGHREGFGAVVGDQHRRHPKAAVQLGDQRAHLAAQVFVQGREGFVQQQHPRLRRQSAGQRDPLLLPAGELIDPPPAVVAHLHLLQESLCLLEPLGFADALHF